MVYFNRFWQFVNSYYKIILVVCVVLILAIASGMSAYFLYKEKKTKPLALTNAGQLSVCSESKAIELIKPNIVKIENKTKNSTTTGTGFFEPTGYLITNSHIVDQKGDITVYYSDQSSAKATLVSNDILKDVAVLSVEKSPVKSLNWANTADLKEPDTLLAIGYALNLPGESSVTKGAYSAKRDAESLNYIQTDTALNPGNSGGPLVNVCGQVVGINSLAVENATIGLALSAESSQSIISNLVQNQKVSYFTGGTRTTVVSNLLKTIGQTETVLDESAESATTSSGTTSGSAASSGKSTGSSSSNSAKKPAINPDYVNCSKDIKLSAQNTSVEINEIAHLYLPAYKTITWDGEGTFKDKTNVGASWYYSQPGIYTLTGSYTNQAGTVCSSGVQITVLQPLNRIDGLSSIQANVYGPEYDPSTNIDTLNMAIYYRNAAGSDITQYNRAYTLPISVKITYYKLTPMTYTRERVIFQKTFTNQEIQGSKSYPTRTVQIPLNSLDVTDSDYTNNVLGIGYDVTVYTPEQGNYNYTMTTTGGYGIRK